MPRCSPGRDEAVEVGRGKHTLWCSEVNDVSIGLEHVDLLNGLDRLDVQLLKCGLELLVVDTEVLWLGLDLSSWGTLSATFTILSASIPRITVSISSFSIHFANFVLRESQFEDGVICLPCKSLLAGVIQNV